MRSLKLFRKTFMLSCLVVGPIFFVLAIAFAIHTATFLHRSISAQGSIIELVPIRDANNNATTFAPKFEFSSAGKTYTVTSDTSSNPAEFALGQRVEIRYEESHPSSARIASIGQLWFFSMAFGIAGTVAGLAGLILLISERRSVKAAVLR